MKITEPQSETLQNEFPSHDERKSANIFLGTVLHYIVKWSILFTGAYALGSSVYCLVRKSPPPRLSPTAVVASASAGAVIGFVRVSNDLHDFRTHQGHAERIKSEKNTRDSCSLGM